ncbi:methyltransferase regulatory domain-containing protein [Solirubrobacter ginsenosidimutans]|uniref:Methyltransferase regulatory domain-containing protein n=1 Tax=Solirubrobacter ginsenosidimutans TaxID=490573 RepID=A0A9X3MW39_9ACTN|nr:methyltransferase regulatory domain-containing protein [Solirubrobacter ginsenosidimutans]MDA0162290.1 methyltransferase regulatory domain-containing protein [Solirubrobacter ginsenosidimutans]
MPRAEGGRLGGRGVEGRLGRQGQQEDLTISLYDAVPYVGRPFAQTHPDRLATLAALFGRAPADPAHCRVLELGCGDGGNLVPLAMVLPDSTFLGIDSAPAAIARGRAFELPNLTLTTASIEAFRSVGEFDYVIAHGVYSWLDAETRDALLAVIARALAPHGVAYVSYNALPGGRLREALRDILRFHTEALEDPRERVDQARALLRFLLAEWPEHQELRPQAELLLHRTGASLLHDELAPYNAPVYFHEFAAHAAAHGLQYLAEADFFESQTTADELRAIDDAVRREQYMDFVKGRMFRQTLLCHADAPVDRSPRPEVIAPLAFSTPAVRDGEAFTGPTGSTLSTDHPDVIAAFERAAGAWPAAVWVRDCDGDAEVLHAALLRAYAANLVQLHVHPPACATHAGERPRVTPLARHQAERGEYVTNLRHALVRVEDERGRRLITLLDGTHDRAALVRELPVEGLDASLESLAQLALILRE